MAGLPHDMFGTLKAPLHSLRGTAGMTGLPHDAFDTLKATVSRIIRKPLPPYTRGMFDILKAPLRGLRGSAAKPTVSHVTWKPLFLFLCGFA